MMRRSMCWGCTAPVAGLGDGAGPGAEALSALIGTRVVPLPRLEGPVFAGPVPAAKSPHRLRATWPDGTRPISTTPTGSARFWARSTNT